MTSSLKAILSTKSGRISVIIFLLVVYKFLYENTNHNDNVDTKTIAALKEYYPSWLLNDVEQCAVATQQEQQEQQQEQQQEHYHYHHHHHKQQQVVNQQEFEFISVFEENKENQDVDEELLYFANRTNFYVKNYLNKYATQKKNRPMLSSSSTSSSSIPCKQQRQRQQQPSLRIVHVWAPYVVVTAQPDGDDDNKDNNNNNNNSNIFAPLDQAQNITWESMYRAQQYATKHLRHSDDEIQIDIYCAILWMDVETLQAHKPYLCRPDNTIVLNRSTATEYPTMKPPIHYPFVQDMIDPFLAGMVSSSSSFPPSFDYLILTNSDIALVEPFYVLVATAIQKYGYEFYTINRRTIRKFKRKTITKTTKGATKLSTTAKNKNKNKKSDKGNPNRRRLLLTQPEASKRQEQTQQSKVRGVHSTTTTTTTTTNDDHYQQDHHHHHHRSLKTANNNNNNNNIKKVTTSTTTSTTSITKQKGRKQQQPQPQPQQPQPQKILDPHKPWTSNDLKTMERYTIQHNYQVHPGTDCFVMNHEILQSISLGNLYVGHPPWARVLKRIMYEYMATSYKTFPSIYGWTFHVGDERSWKVDLPPRVDVDGGQQQPQPQQQQQQQQARRKDSRQPMQLPASWRENKVEGWSMDAQSHAMNDCKFANRLPVPTAHYLQNTKNCADLCGNQFHESIDQVVENLKTNTKLHTIMLNNNNNNTNNNNNDNVTTTTTATTATSDINVTSSLLAASLLLRTNNHNDDDNNSSTTMVQVPPFVLDTERFLRGIQLRWEQESKNNNNKNNDE